VPLASGVALLPTGAALSASYLCGRRVFVRRLAGLFVVALVVLTGCAGGEGVPGSRASSPAISARAANGLPAGVPNRFVAVTVHHRGLGVFATSSGRLLRWLPHTRRATPLALSHDRRSLYLSDETNGNARRCTRRVDLRTGRSRRLGFCATGLAVSADGRMLAYTWLGRDGLSVWLTIRDRVSHRHRRVLVDRNCGGCNNGVDGASLSWSPSDRRLAVSVSYTAAINTLQLLSTWRGTLAHARIIAGCDGDRRSCKEPGFDRKGRLLFTDDGPNRVSEDRWNGHTRTVLYQLPLDRYGFDVLVDPAGNALLWQTSNANGRQQTTDIWINGAVHEIYRNSISRRIDPQIW
jgi:hypothetical protein